MHIPMSDRIRQNGVANLQTALGEGLPFRIAITDRDWCERYPNVFEFGTSDYGFATEMWLSRLFEFSSEAVVSALDQLWITILQFCVGALTTYVNQHDPSSRVRIRPDTTILCQRALCLKAEAKLLATSMGEAEDQLRDSFFPGAGGCFPTNGQCAVGVVTSSTAATMYIIHWRDNHAVLQRIADYSLQQRVDDRVRFIVDIFKVARWMVTITGPVNSFHLLPGIRRRTRNGHHITWVREGLLKELRNPSAGAIARILRVYAAQLAHVEWGQVANGVENAVLVTRIGVTLEHAIVNGLITRELAVDHVRQGLAELHAIGLAHCDVVIDNVFVLDGIAFLDDLEYLTDVDDRAPVTARWDINGPALTALQLDNQLFEQFSIDILR